MFQTLNGALCVQFKSTYGWSPAKFLCDNWATLVECAKLLSVGNLGTCDLS